MKNSKLYRLLFPKRLWSKDDRNIYLTFDDGPIPQVTPWVLNQLNKYGAKATFFCIGDNIKKHPDIFKQIIAEGHSVGNHTQHHLNGWQNSTKNYLKDVQLCQAEIESQKIKTRLFRPPYGKCTGQQAKKLFSKNYELVMWDVLTKDYNQKKTAIDCLKIYKSQVKPGSVVVMHDSQKAFKNLRELLPAILKSGNRFKALQMH